MLCGYKVSMLPLTLRTSGSPWLQTQPQTCHVVRGQWASSSIASYPVIRRMMTSSTQTVRNVVTISTPTAFSLLGWRTSSATFRLRLLFRVLWGQLLLLFSAALCGLWLLAMGLVLEVSSEQFFQSDHALAPWEGF